MAEKSDIFSCETSKFGLKPLQVGIDHEEKFIHNGYYYSIYLVNYKSLIS